MNWKNNETNMNMVSLFHYLLTLIIIESLFLIILNSLNTDSLHFISVGIPRMDSFNYFLM